MHGFFEKHNFRMQTDSGRDKIITALEALHSELFEAWRLAGFMTSLMLAHLLAGREGGMPRLRAELAGLERQSSVPRSPEGQVAHETQIAILKQAIEILQKSERELDS